MDEVVGRSRVMSQDGSSPRLPVAHMVCNQMPPVGDKPSLMTFREVCTCLNYHCFNAPISALSLRRNIHLWP